MSSCLTRNDLKRIFEKLDKNRDGQMSLDELNSLLASVVEGFKLTPNELDSLVGKTSLDFDEFLSFFESISNGKQLNNSNNDNNDGLETSDDLVKAFEVFDLNRDGFISSDELRSVIKRLGHTEDRAHAIDNVGELDFESMIRVFDANSDGKLDFEEFKNMMML